MQPKSSDYYGEDHLPTAAFGAAKKSLKPPNPAADVIRKKISALYGTEPDAKAEAAEVEKLTKRSKHQEMMYSLTSSDLSQEAIQTKWHEYYQALSDAQKHEVWQEFYAAQRPAQHRAKTEEATAVKVIKDQFTNPLFELPAKPENRSVADIKQQVIGKVRTRNTMGLKHHVRSLMFGLSMGAVVVLILLFSFFNERIIAPLITPSRNVSNTPIIIDPDSPVTYTVPEIILPKINVEVPVVYDEPSVEEHKVQAALERGVVHYANTPLPGEQGNAVLFGHSSSNILNSGKYKFAFVLLNKMEVGDTFYLINDGKRYVYRIYERKIVAPTDVYVLGKTDKAATATLITCDPPGTAYKRLVVIGEQITPDPAKNIASTVKADPDEIQVIPSNSPSLWSRITNWF